MGRFQSYVSKRPHPPTRPVNDSLSSTFPHHDSRRLTKRQQDVFKLSQHHGAVLHLVVQLQALNEVLEVAGFLGLLDVAVDWVELAGQEWISWMLERTDSQKTWQSLDARCWQKHGQSSLFSLQLSKINSLRQGVLCISTPSSILSFLHILDKIPSQQHIHFFL